MFPSRVANGVASRARKQASVALLVAFAAPAAMLAQNLTHENGRWVQTITGTAPAGSRLRVNARGPVHLEGGVANQITYTAKVSVQVRSEEDARRILSRFAVRSASAGDIVVLNADSGGVTVNLTVRAPRLNAVAIITTDGAVEANGIDGPLDVNTGAGEIKVDRIAGTAQVQTGGGQIVAGEIGGGLRASTAGGRIAAKKVHGETVLQTSGGDIEITEADADVRADTAGGAIRANTVGGSITATTGGGSINVGKAGGIVIARNMAGPVQVGAASGVRCESGTGGIRVSNIAGPMRVSTTIGNITATILSGRPVADSFLATGNGDITVTIPSNVGVTIRAETDALRRIVSDFPGIAVRMAGTQVMAEGPVNGGGPLLRLSGMGGTIFIKRQP